MPALKNPNHEAIALLLAQGKSWKEAYFNIFPLAKSFNADRLNKIPGFKARIVELREQMSAVAVKLSIRDKDVRIQHAQERHEKLTQAVNRRFESKALRKKHQEVDISQFGELRAIEQHVAVQLGQWDTKPASANVTLNAVIHLPSGAETEKRMAAIVDIEPALIEDGTSDRG